MFTQKLFLYLIFDILGMPKKAQKHFGMESSKRCIKEIAHKIKVIFLKKRKKKTFDMSVCRVSTLKQV